jgi:hypothetical protein
MMRKYSIFISIIVLLGGCAVPHISPEAPEIFIPDRSSEVIINKMDRTEVRTILGTPQLYSKYWGFDLFRSDTEQTEIVIAVTPWPIPFAQITDHLHRYTLVTYDVNAHTTAVSTGLFRKPADWRNVSPIKHDYPALHLRSAELMFYLDPEGSRDMNMLITPSGRDRFLHDFHSSDNCLALIGCTDHGCPDLLSIDKDQTKRLPIRNANAYWFLHEDQGSWLKDIEPSIKNTQMPWLESLVAFKLSLGDHIFDFSSKYLEGTHSINFECHPGEVTYIEINASVNNTFWNSALINWEIKQSTTIPKSFTRRPMVLLNDGQWYVESEPSSDQDK